jgi:asparagine synthase (glutamine-hydrolysing)
MSGIYGFVAQQGTSDPSVLLSRMCEAHSSPRPSVQRQWTSQEGYAGLGAIHPACLGGSPHFAESPSAGGARCVFDGVTYCDPGAQGNTLLEPDGAALLLKRYLKAGIECLQKIDGSFNVAWWDEKARRLVLANDKLGQRPLFWGLRGGVFVFASMLARVMASGVLSPEIDVEGFADLLSYAYILGERTLFKDIHILPPASVLTYADGRVQIWQYWHLDQVEPHGKYNARRLDELEDVFKRAVKRAIRPDVPCTISLTGGLDSRCILAAAANQRLSFTTQTGGQPNSTDVILAKKVAAQVGVQHSFELISPQRLGEWLTPMVFHQGGTIATLHSHPCKFLYAPPAFAAEVQGIGGEFARSHWLSPAALDISDLAIAQKLLRDRMSSRLAKKPQYFEQLWRPEFRSLGLRSAEEHLDTLLLSYKPQKSPATVVDYLYLHERCRKFLNKALLIVRACEEVYLPYLDNQWIEAIAAVPVAERVTNRIQIDLIRRLYPKLLDIPYTKTLLPLSARPWKIWTTTYGRKIRRRVWQRFRVIGRGPVPVPHASYSHWSRNEMRDTLIDLLYNPNAAFRVYLHGETVETLLDQHFLGRESWDDLIAALAVLEIAHRLWGAPRDDL